MAESLRRRFASPDAPVDVEAVAEALRCGVVPPGPIGSTKTVEAELRPDPNSDHFLLRVDPTPKHRWTDLPATRRKTISRHRLRFRIGHELGHTFFFERREDAGPKRVRPWTVGEEGWCDEFARALLIPPGSAKRLPAIADSVFELQSRFDVSLEVAARALSAAHPRLDLALWFWQADEEPVPSSLICQWSNRGSIATLRRWKNDALTTEALGEGSATGTAMGPGGAGRRRHITARCDQGRRQLVLAATR